KWEALALANNRQSGIAERRQRSAKQRPPIAPPGKGGEPVGWKEAKDQIDRDLARAVRHKGSAGLPAEMVRCRQQGRMAQTLEPAPQKRHDLPVVRVGGRMDQSHGPRLADAPVD